MLLYRSAAGVVVQAPAKLNLFFEVIGKRDDGYHEIETVVYPVGLYDTLLFRESDDGPIRLQCEQDVRARRGKSGLGSLPEGEDNLIVRAVDLLRRRAGLERGAIIRLVKRIPSEAGLGGGSSDAAAALAAANASWRLGWSASKLKELGAELGSDVPLFFEKGAAVCRGRGELVASVPGAAPLHLVVVRPPEGLSTAAVYGSSRPPESPRSSRPMQRAIASHDLASIGRELFNRLECAASACSPWIDRVRAELKRAGCLGQLMTGSGSSCFGLCRHARHAHRMARYLGTRGIGFAFPVQGSR